MRKNKEDPGNGKIMGSIIEKRISRL